MAKFSGRLDEVVALDGKTRRSFYRASSVTADALLCQSAIAEQIVDQGGEYGLALKANQSAMQLRCETHSGRSGEPRQRRRAHRRA
jgi:predicted transposase YbfD/YdcC